LMNAALTSGAGLQPVTDLFDLITAAPVDGDPFLWLTILERLRIYDRLYDGSPTQERFRTFARTLAEPLFARIGWETQPNEPENLLLLRQSLILSLGQFGDPKIIAEARRRFTAFLSDPTSLPATLRDSILRVVAYHADAETLEKLIALAKAAPSELERKQFLIIATEIHDAALGARLRDIILGPGIPESLTSRLLFELATRQTDATWTFAKTHWSEIKSRLDSLQAVEFLPALVSTSSSAATIEDMRRFTRQNLAPEAERNAEKAAHQAQSGMRLRAEQLPKLDKWLGRAGY